VWEVPRPKCSPEHPTTKPVALVARALVNSSLPGALVLDPFLGSGSTLIAAEQLSRTCFGLEIDPAFCDCVVTRWQNLTGREAVRDVR
jgi:DNA modification methylase